MTNHKMTDDKYAEWVQSAEGKAAIRASFEQHRRSGVLRKKGRAHELLEAAGQMNVPISLRLPAADLAKAREIAQRKGVPYQTFIKMLLHEALATAK